MRFGNSTFIPGAGIKAGLPNFKPYGTENLWLDHKLLHTQHLAFRQYLKEIQTRGKVISLYLQLCGIFLYGLLLKQLTSDSNDAKSQVCRGRFWQFYAKVAGVGVGKEADKQAGGVVGGGGGFCFRGAVVAFGGQELTGKIQND